jgi:hypothetical protein
MAEKPSELLLLWDAAVDERGKQSEVRANGIFAGGGLIAALTINAVKFWNVHQ